MFFWCGRYLREIKSDCLIGSLPGDGKLLNLSRELDETAREKARQFLGHLEVEFRKIGLQITADTAKELIEDLLIPAPTQNFQWLIDRIDCLEKLADKELRGKLFLYIPAEQAKYWPTEKRRFPLGEMVADKFPSTNFDAGNSGHALAVELPTAAVFHLMRVLEIGLTALGKVFGVSLAYTNWEPALAQIESKIANMRNDPTWNGLPDCKEQQEYYSQAASYLRTVKDAWRNYTMHVRAKYSDNEAEQIFNAVKGFMQKLAERVSE
jgi:hypothetical protein